MDKTILGITLLLLGFLGTVTIAHILFSSTTTSSFACYPPNIIKGTECCLDQNNDNVCDQDVAQTQQYNAPVCPPHYVAKGKECCIDKNDNQVCDLDDEEVARNNNNACNSNWVCSEWSACIQDGTQTRTCVDYNGCGSNETPIEKQYCSYEPESLSGFKDTLNSHNQQFDVAVIVDKSSNYQITDDEIKSVMLKASQELNARTMQTMRLQEIYYTYRSGRSDSDMVNEYVDLNLNNPPEGILIFSYGSEPEKLAKTVGAYSNIVRINSEYCNEFYINTERQEGTIYLAVVNWAHMYSRCGYDENLNHISAKSIGDECRGQANTPCVWNSETGYYICYYAANDLYAKKDVFRVASIIHEFMHPFGSNGNQDHYGTAECTEISGGSYGTTDNTHSQIKLGLCGYVYNNFMQALNGCNTAATSVTVKSCSKIGQGCTSNLECCDGVCCGITGMTCVLYCK